MKKLKEDSHKKIDWSNRILLLVDDDFSSSSLIKEILADTKINIIVAQTGQKAILTMQTTENISIVLLDIKLPEIDGFEVCKKMREINSTIPIIAYTALNLNEIAKRWKTVRFDDILLKPICIKGLFNILNKYLQVDN